MGSRPSVKRVTGPLYCVGCIALALSACSGQHPEADMSAAPDLGTTRDLAHVSDMSGASDMTPQTPDLFAPFHFDEIQSDMIALGCGAVGCHSKSGVRKFKVDPTPGQEMANYNLLFTNMLVIKGSPDTSPLITIPSTGAGPTGAHVLTLTGFKLQHWQTWVSTGAPF